MFTPEEPTAAMDQGFPPDRLELAIHTPARRWLQPRQGNTRQVMKDYSRPQMCTQVKTARCEPVWSLLCVFTKEQVNSLTTRVHVSPLFYSVSSAHVREKHPFGVGADWLFLVPFWSI